MDVAESTVESFKSFNSDPALRPVPEMTPEQNLWGAVLLDAAKLAALFVDTPPGRGVGDIEPDELKDAHKWWHEQCPLFSEQIGGFTWVCRYLGFNVEATRSLINSPEWRKWITRPSKRTIATSLFRAGPAPARSASPPTG